MNDAERERFVFWLAIMLALVMNLVAHGWDSHRIHKKLDDLKARVQHIQAHTTGGEVLLDARIQQEKPLDSRKAAE